MTAFKWPEFDIEKFPPKSVARLKEMIRVVDEEIGHLIRLKLTLVDVLPKERKRSHKKKKPPKGAAR